MTAVIEAPRTEESAVSQHIQRVYDAATPQEQWGQVGVFEWLERGNPHVETALFDLAADQESGIPPIVRMRALHVGMSRLSSAARQAERGGEPLTETQAAHYALLQRLVPTYFETDAAWLMNTLDVSQRRERYYGAGEMISKELAKAAGLDPADTLYPFSNDYDVDDRLDRNALPAGPILMIDQLVGLNQPGTKYLPPVMYGPLAELVLDFRSGRLEEALADPNAHALASFARLGRLTRAGGYAYDVPIEYLFERRDNPEVVRFIQELNRLYDIVPSLARIFPDPEIHEHDVQHAVRRLVAGALFSLQEYLEGGGRIDTSISFPGGTPFEVVESEPLELLQATTDALALISEAMTNPHTYPEFGPGGPDFYHCRFVTSGSVTPARVSYHGRAQSGGHFDPTYEFAGDSTSRFRVQLDGDQPIALHNAGQTPRTLSIRLDHDRFGFAFDLGALRSNPHTATTDLQDLEVRIGRFFALGNYRRAALLGEHPTMNHARTPHTEAALTAHVRAQEERLRRRAAGFFAGTTHAGLAARH